MILPQSFYNRSPDIVARELLGATLVHTAHGHVRAGRIVETEAYFSDNDGACHAASGKTSRNNAMFGPPGHAYVYFCYGNHWLVNAVTEGEGTASAVLIRALEPFEGIDAMRRARGNRPDRELTNGPGKLCAALGITREHNSLPLFSGPLTIRAANAPPAKIRTSRRIGIRDSAHLEARYFIAGNAWVSKARPS